MGGWHHGLDGALRAEVALTAVSARCPLLGVKRTSLALPQMSASDPGCVKTFMGCNFGEMTSPLRPSQNSFQHVSHLKGLNAEQISKRLDRVDVFTQPGPKADIEGQMLIATDPNLGAVVASCSRHARRRRQFLSVSDPTQHRNGLRLFSSHCLPGGIAIK